MSHLDITTDLFYRQAGIDQKRIEGMIGDALHGADDGELYLQYSQSEAITWDDGRIKSASYDTDQGFGVRSVAEDRFGYAHSTELSEAAIARAIETVKTVHTGRNAQLAIGPTAPGASLYTAENPLPMIGFEDKVGLLARIDAYARAKYSRVRQVSASIADHGPPSTSCAVMASAVPISAPSSALTSLSSSAKATVRRAAVMAAAGALPMLN